jgi:hypothetical protein
VVADVENYKILQDDDERFLNYWKISGKMWIFS